MQWQQLLSRARLGSLEAPRASSARTDFQRDFDRVVFFTGAGISAESGVPTFREADGLWEQYRIEEVATPQALRRNPRMVWEFYEMRRANMSQVQPNAGHRALAEMERLDDPYRLWDQEPEDWVPAIECRHLAGSGHAIQYS